MDSLYSPLDIGLPMIRLLELKPGLDNDKIECRMFPVSLEDEPSYEALSYTWGDVSTTTKIWINNVVKDVTLNLAGALANLRYPTSSRVLWVDAVCINQEDLQERNHQVRQMTHIYSKGNQTTVWLGGQKGTPNRRPGMEALQLLSRFGVVIFTQRLHEAYPYVAKQERPPWITNQKEEFKSFAMTVQLIKSLRSLQHLSVIEFLSKLPWWRRGWVLQEVVVARKVVVVFGTATCDWEHLAAVFKLLSQYKDENVDLLSASMTGGSVESTTESPAHKKLDYQIVTMNDLREMRAQQKQVTLCDVIYLQRHSLCTVPVDKVYSILGLLSRQDRSSVLLDYQRKDVEIFRNVTQFIIESRGRLDFLCLVQRLRPHRRRPELSSWTPDWGTELHNSLGYQPFQNPIFQASKRNAQVTFKDDLRIMVARGVCFDTVKEVSDESNIREIEEMPLPASGWLNIMVKFMTRENNQVYSGKALRSQVWWRTIIGGQMTMPDGIFEAHPDMEKMFHYTLGEGDPPALANFSSTMSIEERRKEASRPFVKEVVRAVKGRRLFITSKGYLGLGPGNSNVGDQVCVLRGLCLFCYGVRRTREVVMCWLGRAMFLELCMVRLRI